MIIRINPFSDIDLDRGINTVFVDSPVVYSTIIMRLYRLSKNEDAAEPIALLEDGTALDINKELIVISDPLTELGEETKIQTALRKHIFKRLAEKPGDMAAAERYLSEAADYIRDVVYSMPFDIDAGEVNTEALIKSMAPKPDMSQCRSPREMLLFTARLIAELRLWRVAVFAGVRGFLTDEGASELFGELQKLPLRCLFVDRFADIPPAAGERRMIIESNMWDHTLTAE